MANPVTSESISSEANRLWQEIALQFREVCILRRQGRHAGATRHTEEHLSPAIRSWFEVTGLPATEAKARLSSLFNDEQARVESGWIVARLLSDRLSGVPSVHQLAAFATPPGAAGTFYPPIPPHRIPIDEVVEMIDSARESARLATLSP